MLNEKNIIKQLLQPLALNEEAQNLENDAAVLKKTDSKKRRFGGDETAHRRCRRQKTTIWRTPNGTS